jgi:hypothetical protein
MNQHTAHEQQPRLPGVRYRRVTLERDETTVIDGIPSTRKVPYDVWEPVPPRDWDDVILRGVTGVTLGVTGLAVVATTASVGGLLTRLIRPELAYAVGVVFTLTWLCCHGVEWLQTRGGGQAYGARVAGWVALAISMGAVITYGHTLDQTAAGVVGGSIDLLSKGLLTLVMGLYRVQLNPDTAHWLRDQEQRLTGKAYLAVKLRRINRHATYLRAVGGREMDVAEAITTVTQGPGSSAIVPGPRPAAAPAVPPVPPAPSGPGPVAQAAAPVPAQPSGQVPDASGQQSAPLPAPTAQAPAPTTPVSSGQAPAPAVAPAAAPAADPADASGQVPDPSGQPSAPVSSGQASQPSSAQQSAVLPMAPSMRQIVAQALKEDQDMPFEDLLQRVKDVHGDRPKLAGTVERYQRKELKALRDAS